MTAMHVGTPVPRTCMHALGTGYVTKSPKPLWFRQEEGTCASTGTHPPGVTRMSLWWLPVLPVMPKNALLGATCQVKRDVS